MTKVEENHTIFSEWNTGVTYLLQKKEDQLKCQNYIYNHLPYPFLEKSKFQTSKINMGPNS